MGNKQKRVGYSTHNKRRNRQLNINKLQHANNARLQGNAAAQVPQIVNNKNNDSISVNSSVNTTSDNCNGDHPPLGRKKTTEMLLEEAEKITSRLPNKRIRKGVLCCQPSLPTPVAGGISQSQSDIPIVDDPLTQISELDQIIMRMNETFINIGGKTILFVMSRKYLE